MIGHRGNVITTSASMPAPFRAGHRRSPEFAAPARSGGYHGWAQPGHDPDDLVGQMAGHTEGVEGRGEMARGPVEVTVGDAQATVRLDKVGSPVALGTAQRLTEDRDDVRTVLSGNAPGEEPAEHRVGDEPPVEAVYGGGNGRPAADRLVDVDRGRLGGRGGVCANSHGRSPCSGCYRDDPSCAPPRA